jgi:hypothetical protein
MKSIATIFFILCSIYCKGQQQYISPRPEVQMDTVSVSMSKEIRYMRSELVKSQNNFNGAIVCFVAASLSIVVSQFADTPPEGFQYASIGLSCLGTIFLITSHSHIGKAGVGIGGNGVYVKYKF